MEKPKKGEILRWYRNINIATGVGAVAMSLAFPGAREAWLAIAAVQGVQALGAEAIRQARIRKSKSTTV